MRTGTHYFPRGVSSVAAVEQSRQKFGLNKIDETVGGTGETTPLNGNYHRRTESLSCELSRRHFGHNGSNGIAAEAALGNGHKFLTNNMMAAAAAAAAAASPGMSPDVQRRLALQTYKAMECKLKIKVCVHSFNFILTFSSVTTSTLSNQNKSVVL